MREKQGKWGLKKFHDREEISPKIDDPRVPHSHVHMDVKQGLMEDKVGRRKDPSKMSKIAGKLQKVIFSWS